MIKTLGNGFICLLAGVLVTLSLAPFNIWLSGILASALLCWQLQAVTPGVAALKAWLFGFGLFGSGASWVYVSIHQHGNASLPLAIFLTVIFCAGLALFPTLLWYLYRRWFSNTGILVLLSFPSIWVLEEWLRGWLLTGFPWLYLGYGHIDTWLAGWGPVTGVFGISFCSAFTGTALVYCFQKQATKRWLAIAIAASLWIGGGLLQQFNWVEDSTTAPTLQVSLVQPNISQHDKWLARNYLPTLQRYEQMSEPLWQTSDIVVWPEAAIPSFYERAKPFIDEMAVIAKNNQSTLITGIPTSRRFQNEAGETLHKNYNSVLAVGVNEGIYHKQHLVPFGEYVPLESILRGLIDFFDMPSSHFTAAPANQKPLSVNGYQISPFICYEIAYADLVANGLGQPDLLMTLSNDAWFGDSIGPLQHLQIAQMRALENSRYLVRATGTGISAIIDHHGKIKQQTAQFQQETLSGTVKLFKGNTPFSVTGSTPIVLLAFVLALYCFRHHSKK